MSIRNEIKSLARILEDEEEVAMDLWQQLPSYRDACERHGDYALNHCPLPSVVILEAAEAFRVLADHESDDRTGLLHTFGCGCEHHEAMPKVEHVEEVLGRYQPGFRWGRALEDSAFDQIATLEREVQRLREEVTQAKSEASALMEKANAALVEAIDAKKAAESGALADLQAQLKRLMETHCPSMAFGFGPEDTAKAVTSEVAEILAESPGSEAAQRECAGLLAAAVRMAMVHGADPVECMRSEAERLKSRLDTMARVGCTWAAAKVIEADPRLERLWLVITMEAIRCEIAAWMVDGDDPQVVVMPRKLLNFNEGILVGDCFPHGSDVRILPIVDAQGWWRAIFSTEQAGYLVAIRDDQGPRFEKARP